MDPNIVVDPKTLNDSWNIILGKFGDKIYDACGEDAKLLEKITCSSGFNKEELRKAVEGKEKEVVGFVEELIKYTIDLSIRLSLLYSNIKLKSPREKRVARVTQEPRNKHTRDTLPRNFWENNDCSIVTLDANHDWAECKSLVRDVFFDISKLYFFIPKEKKLTGRLVSVTATHPKPTTIVHIIEHFNRESGETEKEAVFLDEKTKYRNYSVIKKINSPLYFHSFIEEKGRKYVLLSKDKLLPQRCSVWGLNLALTDESRLGESEISTIPIETPILFLHSLEPTVPKIDEKEYKKVSGETHEWLSKGIFGDFRHPEWFEKVIFSFLFHHSWGDYPVHFFWFATGGTGKSTLMDNLKEAFDEEKVFTGAGSTLKGLVPSFGTTLPEPGYLATSKRFSLVDEFLRVISHERRHEREGVDEKLGIMNDLLEHRLRDFRSGKGKAELQMTARVLVATNPIYTTKNVVDLANQIDNAFLSRFLLYNQTKQHIEFVQKRSIELSAKKPEKAKLNEKIISIADYLQTLRVDLDHEKINKIFDATRKVVPEGMLNIYDMRYHHHLQCLADGYIKYKSFLRGTMPEAKEEDYKEIEALLLVLVMSWKEAAELDIFNVPLKARHSYVSLNAAKVFNKIERSVRTTLDELVGLFAGDLSEGDVWAAADELRRSEMTKDVEHRGKTVLVPWWYSSGGLIDDTIRKEAPLNEALLQGAFKKIGMKEVSHEDLVAELENQGITDTEKVINWGLSRTVLFRTPEGRLKMI